MGIVLFGSIRCLNMVDFVAKFAASSPLPRLKGDMVLNVYDAEAFQPLGRMDHLLDRAWHGPRLAPMKETSGWMSRRPPSGELPLSISMAQILSMYRMSWSGVR